MTFSTTTILERVLKNRFYAGAEYNYDNLVSFLKHVNFPERDKEFKKELSDAILQGTISIHKFESLTGIDFESPEEVVGFLTNELWRPLYGNSPISRTDT